MDKNKFIQDLLNLIQSPIRPGETAPILSQEQIEALYSAPDTTTAANYAIKLGLGEYVTIVGKQIPTEYFEDDAEFLTAVNNAMIADTPKFIGVDPAQQIVYQGQETTIAEVGNNFYQVGDNNTFSNLTPAQIRDIQADLVNADLLGAQIGRAFRPGFWDPKVDGEAMKDVMTLANIMGVGKAEDGWKQALVNYTNNPLPQYQNIQPYIPPNYDSIAQDVKGIFRSRLGRDPKEYEIGLLYDVYDAEARKAFPTTPEMPDATPVTLEMYATEFEPDVVMEDIDPGAKTMETFDKITRKEQEAIQAGQDIQDSRQRIINSIAARPR
jgi:hypothetical protein